MSVNMRCITTLGLLIIKKATAPNAHNLENSSIGNNLGSSYFHVPLTTVRHLLNQGWVFAMAKTIFAGTVEKTGKNRGKN